MKAGLIYEGVYTFIHNWSVNVFSNAMCINLIDPVKDEFVFSTYSKTKYIDGIIFNDW